MLLVANFANTKCEKSLKITESLANEYSYDILNESFPMNTNMTGLG